MPSASRSSSAAVASVETFVAGVLPAADAGPSAGALHVRDRTVRAVRLVARLAWSHRRRRGRAPRPVTDAGRAAWLLHAPASFTNGTCVHLGELARFPSGSPTAPPSRPSRGPSRGRTAPPARCVAARRGPARRARARSGPGPCPAFRPPAPESSRPWPAAPRCRGSASAFLRVTRPGGRLPRHTPAARRRRRVMSNPLVTEARIVEEVQKALAKSLRKEPAAIRMDASVIDDLGRDVARLPRHDVPARAGVRHPARPPRRCSTTSRRRTARARRSTPPAP